MGWCVRERERERLRERERERERVLNSISEVSTLEHPAAHTQIRANACAHAFARICVCAAHALCHVAARKRDSEMSATRELKKYGNIKHAISLIRSDVFIAHAKSESVSCTRSLRPHTLVA
jgi:hypothetical protein